MTAEPCWARGVADADSGAVTVTVLVTTVITVLVITIGGATGTADSRAIILVMPTLTLIVGFTIPNVPPFCMNDENPVKFVVAGVNVLITFVPGAKFCAGAGGGVGVGAGADAGAGASAVAIAGAGASIITAGVDVDFAGT